MMRYLEKCGLENDDDPLAADDPLLATLTAASIRSRIATGSEAGDPWRGPVIASNGWKQGRVVLQASPRFPHVVYGKVV